MNNKINISNRLKTIGDFTINNSKIVDVGCDHGLLSIYIVKKHNKVKIIASDINQKPLDSAIENIKKYNLEKQIKTRISDGLKNININEFDTIIISGLGGNKIVEILSDDINKTKNADRIIIQANNNIQNIRRFLTKNNYIIKDEKLVEENNIISTIILFVKNSTNVKYSKEEILFGPILISSNNILMKKQLMQILKKEKHILEKIPKKYIIKRYKINKTIKKIKKIIKNMNLI